MQYLKIMSTSYITTKEFKKSIIDKVYSSTTVAYVASDDNNGISNFSKSIIIKRNNPIKQSDNYEDEVIFLWRALLELVPKYNGSVDIEIVTSTKNIATGLKSTLSRMIEYLQQADIRLEYQEFSSYEFVEKFLMIGGLNYSKFNKIIIPQLGKLFHELYLKPDLSFSISHYSLNTVKKCKYHREQVLTDTTIDRIVKKTNYDEKLLIIENKKYYHPATIFHNNFKLCMNIVLHSSVLSKDQLYNLIKIDTRKPKDSVFNDWDIFYDTCVLYHECEDQTLFLNYFVENIEKSSQFKREPEYSNLMEYYETIKT